MQYAAFSLSTRMPILFKYDFPNSQQLVLSFLMTKIYCTLCLNRRKNNPYNLRILHKGEGLGLDWVYIYCTDRINGY